MMQAALNIDASPVPLPGSPGSVTEFIQLWFISKFDMYITEQAMSVEGDYIRSSLAGELSKHLDKWIVAVGKDIVYIGENAKEGYDKAIEKYPDSSPFIIKFPKESVMLL